MRKKSKKLIRCICMLSAVTIILFATVIAVSAKERPHTFRDQAASETVNEQVQVCLDFAEEFVAPSEMIVEQKAKVTQAARLSEQIREEAAEDEDDWDEEEEDEEEIEDDWDEEEVERPDSDWDISHQYDEWYSADELRFLGVIYAGDFRWTWYSQNVLPGGGLQIPGRHVDENGFICDENDRICLASSDLEWGTIVTTPFGKEGCIYDCGCASGTLDVYVDF